MTLLGIGAIVTIVVALAGVMDSFDRTLDVGRREALAGAPDRLTVDLVAPVRTRAAQVRGVSSAASVGASEASLRLPSTLVAGRRRVDVALEIVPQKARLWNPTLRTGTLPAESAGLVVAQRAAEDLGVGIGDRLALVHPVPTGAGTSQLVRTVLPITGVHASPFRFVAYASPSAAAALHVAGLVNRLSVRPAAGRDADDVKAELLRQPAVGAVQSASATTDAVDARMAQFREILLITVAIAGGMALLIAFNGTAINADERAREYATMFAYGIPPARVTRLGMAEALLVGALGTVAGVVAGHALLSWIITTTMPETMPDVGMLATVAPATYALAVVAGTLVVAAAPLLLFRRLRRTDVPSALRVVE